MDRLSNWQIAILLSLTAACLSAALTFFLFPDYAQDQDFMRYRLAQNIHAGHGPVYNAGENTLLTLSPLALVLIAPLPRHAHTLAALLSILSTGVSAGLLYILLRREAIRVTVALSIIMLWLFAWSTWYTLRSPHGLAFTVALGAIVLAQRRNWRTAGVVLGLAPLIQAEGTLAALVIGIWALQYEDGFRLWRVIWIPTALWAVYAVFFYDDLHLVANQLSPAWQDYLWLGGFILSILFAQRRPERGINWLFLTWGALALFVNILFTGQTPVFASLPAAFAVAYVIGTALPSKLAPVAAICAAFLLVVVPPQTDEAVLSDQQLASTIPDLANMTLAFEGTDALLYYLDGFTGSAYRLDGVRSPQITEARQEDDLASTLIRLAPDYILGDVEVSDSRLAAFDYQPVDDTLYQNTGQIGSWTTWTPVEVDYAADVRLTDYRLDRQRLTAGETLRLGLRWQLDAAPELPLGLNINLLDVNANPIASSFPVFTPATWADLNAETYHVLALPETLDPGLHRIEVGAEYRAGRLDRHVVAEIITPFPFDEVDQSEIIDALANVVLHRHEITQADDDNLQIRLFFGVTEPLTTDYQIFLHLTPLDSPVPVAQADGPPLNGRYPTTYWYPGDIIRIERTISLTDVPAGEYRIRAGFYTLEGERLTDDSDDALQVAQVTLNADSTIMVTD